MGILLAIPGREEANQRRDRLGWEIRVTSRIREPALVMGRLLTLPTRLSVAGGSFANGRHIPLRKVWATFLLAPCSSSNTATTEKSVLQAPCSPACIPTWVPVKHRQRPSEGQVHAGAVPQHWEPVRVRFKFCYASLSSYPQHPTKMLGECGSLAVNLLLPSWGPDSPEQAGQPDWDVLMNPGLT